MASLGGSSARALGFLVPLADSPQAFILRMFELEAHEGRGSHCKTHPNGARIPGLPLDDDELVYGIYKEKYYYSAQSLIIGSEAPYIKVRWAQIAHCSTTHGDGERQSILTLADGSKVTVPIAEFVIGYSGRTSQLYHGMIKRWGAEPAFGGSPLSVADFFDSAADAYSFAPNLDPHPTLDEIRRELESLLRVPSVIRVMLLPCNGVGEEVAVRTVVVVSNGNCHDATLVGTRLGATRVGELSATSLRQCGPIDSKYHAVELLWD